MNTTTEEPEAWLMELFEGAVYAPTAIAEPAATVAIKAKPSCVRCGGSGRISGFSHIKGGECFKCHGTGI